MLVMPLFYSRSLPFQVPVFRQWFVHNELPVHTHSRSKTLYRDDARFTFRRLRLEPTARRATISQRSLRNRLDSLSVSSPRFAKNSRNQAAAFKWEMGKLNLA